MVGLLFPIVIAILFRVLTHWPQMNTNEDLRVELASLLDLTETDGLGRIARALVELQDEQRARARHTARNSGAGGLAAARDLPEPVTLDGLPANCFKWRRFAAHGRSPPRPIREAQLHLTYFGAAGSCRARSAVALAFCLFKVFRCCARVLCVPDLTLALFGIAFTLEDAGAPC
jgi:hypothetical protein